MNARHPRVDDYLSVSPQWREELVHLRTILLDSPLDEDFKWRNPCYTYRGRNVSMLGRFKDYCALTFFQGALLKDPAGILRKPGENTRAGRLVAFTGMRNITELEPTLKAYLHEAVELERAGKKVDLSQDQTTQYPDELTRKFDDDPALQSAFFSLTPGRQRGYLLHFSGAKQSGTRTARIEKFAARIMDGKGMNDCTCGLSRRMPACDGSHRALRP